MRIVFFGTPDFAVPSLEALLASRHQVVGVVTQPDRPRGRGQHVSGSPVKARAEAAGIPDPATDEMKRPRTARRPQVARPGSRRRRGVRAHPAEALLDLPRLGMINVHASLLPRHRGAAPVQRAILDGDTRTGDDDHAGRRGTRRRADAGDPRDGDRARRDRRGARGTTRDAGRRAARWRSLDALDRGNVVETPQDEAHATYAPRIVKQDGLIEWVARRRHPQPGARRCSRWPARLHVPQRRAPRAA